MHNPTELARTPTFTIIPSAATEKATIRPTTIHTPNIQPSSTPLVTELEEISENNIDRLEILETLNFETDVSRVVFGKDERIITGTFQPSTGGKASQSKVIVWDLKKGIPEIEFAFDGPFSDITVDYKHNILAVGAQQFFYDFTTKKENWVSESYRGMGAGIEILRFDPVRSRYAVGLSMIGVLQMRDSETHAVLFELEDWFPCQSPFPQDCTRIIWQMAFSPDGNYLAVDQLRADGGEGLVLLNAEKGRLIRKIPSLDFDTEVMIDVSSLQFDHTSQNLLIGGSQVAEWNLQEKNYNFAFDIGVPWRSLVSALYSNDEELIITSVYGDPNLKIWRRGDQTLLKSFRINGEGITHIAKSQDGKRLAITFDTQVLILGVIAIN